MIYLTSVSEPVNKTFAKTKNTEIRERSHGGNLTAAAEEFGVPLDQWLDLSTGINPTAYSNTDLSSETFRNLPTPGEVNGLLDAARTYYRTPDSAEIIAAPGTQAILQTLPRFTPPSKVAILSPTYNEHPFCWSEAGHQVRLVERFEDLNNCDIAVLVNPNNPDGRQTTPEDIRQLATQIPLVIVDEAFGDQSPGLSVVPYCNMGNLMVLRSVGKFFGLAGLRLGFAIGPQEILDILRQQLGPWAVGGPAIEIGRRALADDNWITQMQRHLIEQRQELDHILIECGLTIFGGTDLFRLIDHPRSQDIFRQLGRAGILTRRFDNHPTWLRLGLPGNDAERHRLKSALKG